MLPTLIGIHGKARAGKDTLAKIIMSLYPDSYRRYAFAEPIKKACNLIFGWDDRHADGSLKEVVDPEFEVSPRFAYQKLGTEWGRDIINNDLWLLVAGKKVRLNKEVDNVGTIITDVRFDNEAAWVLERNGVLIHVVREEQAIIEESSHVSERGLDEKYLEKAFRINNNGTGFDGLVQQVRENFH